MAESEDKPVMPGQKILLNLFQNIIMITHNVETMAYIFTLLVYVNN